jgi:hypothetical protein
MARQQERATQLQYARPRRSTRRQRCDGAWINRSFDDGVLMAIVGEATSDIVALPADFSWFHGYRAAPGAVYT